MKKIKQQKWEWKKKDLETAYLIKKADQNNIEFIFYAAENEISNKIVFMWKLISIE